MVKKEPELDSSSPNARKALCNSDSSKGRDLIWQMLLWLAPNGATKARERS